MSTPLSATWRMVINWTTDGLPHRYRSYVKAAVPSTGTDFDIICNDGTAGVKFSAIAEHAAIALGGQLSSSLTAFGQIELQNLSGTAWLPVQFYSPTAVPTGTGAYVKASVQTFTMSDSLFHKIRGVIHEGNIQPGLKQTTPVYGSIINHDMNKWLTSTSTAPHLDAPNVIVGRSNLYLTNFVSCVTDLDNHLRNLRGIR